MDNPALGEQYFAQAAVMDRSWQVEVREGRLGRHVDADVAGTDAAFALLDS